MSNDQRIVIGTPLGGPCRSTRGVWKAPGMIMVFHVAQLTDLSTVDVFREIANGERSPRLTVHVG